ncbi:MAG: hypothetical protein ACK559_38250, partial [bacterium]
GRCSLYNILLINELRWMVDVDLRLGNSSSSLTVAGAVVGLRLALLIFSLLFFLFERSTIENKSSN